MISCRYLTLVAAAVFLACTSRAQTVQLEMAFPSLQFERPVDLQQAGDLLFVVEQRGIIWVFDRDPAVSAATEFLDIRSRVSRGGNEEGLLGLAFAPDYTTSGDFYVYYSARSPRRSIVARYRRSASDVRAADATSEDVLLTVAQPYSNHNGGQLAFGPDDGYLYIGLGDGGSGGDPLNHGQNRTTLLGSLLRIDVSTTPYGIPADNPFTGNTDGYKEEIWAWGLRNPWRFSFDTATGRLYLADVGQNAWEEVDVIVKGGNYGWRTMEGPACFRPPANCNRAGLELPEHAYASNGAPRSITGGYVYRSTSVPELVGRYLYGDYVEGTIWGMGTDSTAQNTELLDTSLNIASFGQDAYGEVYILAFDGRIYRFAPAPLDLNDAVDNQMYTVGMPVGPVALPGATGGMVPYSFALTPDLPPGLHFDSDANSISGTPSAPLTATSYTWEVTDHAGHTALAVFTITVAESTGRARTPSPVTGVRVHGTVPNPSWGQTDMVIDLEQDARVAITVLDLLGRVVFMVPPLRMSPGAGQRIRLDTSVMPAGTYLYQVTIDSQGEWHVETGTMLYVRR